MSEHMTLAQFYRFDAGEIASGAQALAKAGKIVRSQKLTPALRTLAADALVATAKNLLKSPISDVLADGWGKWRELGAYADAAKYPPGKLHEYALDEHDIALSREPKAEILLNGGSIGLVFPFELKLGLKLRSAVLKIMGGRIVGARIGAVHGFGSFSCGDVTLAERKSGKVDLPGEMMFNPGYTLRS
jgi:hypothetical protein